MLPPLRSNSDIIEIENFSLVPLDRYQKLRRSNKVIFAKLILNSTSFQSKLRLRVALFQN